MAETLIIYLHRGKPDKKAELKRQRRDRIVHGTKSEDRRCEEPTERYSFCKVGRVDCRGGKHVKVYAETHVEDTHQEADNVRKLRKRFHFSVKVRCKTIH